MESRPVFACSPWLYKSLGERFPEKALSPFPRGLEAASMLLPRFEVAGFQWF
jgi:hypothetical protein